MVYLPLPQHFLSHHIPLSLGAMAGRGAVLEKAQLTESLLKRLLPGFIPPWQGPILTRDRLGRPHLDISGISISFSSCCGVIYGALAKAATVGIDVAAAAEFTGRYPFHRVFHAKELALAGTFCSDRPESAAFLWTCKEAVVKAKGCGFGKIAPADIEITACKAVADGFTVEIDNDDSLTLATHRLAGRWLTIAVPGRLESTGESPVRYTAG
jgi:phosphopantetheinyl transferase